MPFQWDMCPVLWSAPQLSTTAAKEVIWIRRCLKDILGKNKRGPTQPFYDNQGAMALSENPVFHARTKHIEISHHFIREAVALKEVTLMYVHTSKNVADLLTKVLPAGPHQEHYKSLKLRTELEKGGHIKKVVLHAPPT